MASFLNDKNNRVYLVIGVLFLLLVAIFAYFNSGKKQLDWAENYKQENKDPYGLHIAKQLLKATGKKLNNLTGTIAKGLPVSTPATANYVFIGTSPYFDSSDVQRLTDFVRGGNTAFLAIKDLPKNLRDSLVSQYVNPVLMPRSAAKLLKTVGEQMPDDTAEIQDSMAAESGYAAILDSIKAADNAQRAGDFGDNSEETGYEEGNPLTDLPNDDALIKYYKSDMCELNTQDSIAKFNFEENGFKQTKPYIVAYKSDYKNNLYTWSQFKLDCFKGKKYKNGVRVLGKMNDSAVCFVKIKYGKGFFLLHASPLVFTNYYLMNREAVNYLQSIINYMPSGEIYWDEPSKSYRNLDGDRKAFHPEVGMDYKGPFDYLLSQPALRWAFYLMYLFAIVYLIFRAKRLQRAIPIIEENTNTSIEFADNMGRLYYLQNDHKKLAEQKMKIFMHTLREKYNLPTHLSNEELIPRIVEKTGVLEPVVRPIFSQNEYINYSGEISQEDLIEFHNLLAQFYFAAKS